MIENEVNIGNKFIMRVNFNLSRKGTNTKSQIWLTTTINKQRARVYTGLLIEECYWQKVTRNQRGGRAYEDGNFSNLQKVENKRINVELKKILGYCKEYASAVADADLQHDAIPFTRDSFVRFISDRIRGKSAIINKDAEEYIKNYILRKSEMVNKNTRRQICKGTLYNHKNALKRLQGFCRDKHKKICWDLFNQRFEEMFISWMNKKGYAANTIASQFSIMKVWLSDEEDEGILVNKYFHKYPTKTLDVDNIFLTEEEIEKLYNIDFSKVSEKYNIDAKSSIEQTRDLFIVACWTGLRYGDWRDLSKSQITGDRIKICTHKTRKEVIIPIHPMVKAILEKYQWKLPKGVDKTVTNKQIRKCGEIAHINDPVVISKIRGGKEVIVKQPKYMFITNHTARRSFCTNMCYRGLPIRVIMAISGHTTEANFLKYVKIDKETYANIVSKSFEKERIVYRDCEIGLIG